MITIVAGEGIALFICKILKLGIRKIGIRGVLMGIVDSIKNWFGIGQSKDPWTGKESDIHNKSEHSRQTTLPEFMIDDEVVQEAGERDIYTAEKVYEDPGSDFDDVPPRTKRRIATNVVEKPKPIEPLCPACSSPMELAEFDEFKQDNKVIHGVEAWLCTNDKCNKWILDDEQKKDVAVKLAEAQQT